MLKDSQGLEVTTNSPMAIALIDDFAQQSLSYGNNAETILSAIATDPGCAYSYAHAAAHYLSLESAQSRRQATPYIQAAKKYAATATEREQLYICAIDAWATGAIKSAIAYHEEIAEKFPRDLISVQRGQYHYFYQGNKEGLLNIAQKVLPASPDNHYLQGMIAFGFEQCHKLEEAEAFGRRALEINRHDPWAQHAVAHVMESLGQIDEGIAWMSSFTDTWENCNSMLYTHNWWHIALFYLEKGDNKKVLELYDRHIWGKAWQESSKDQVGAISLLLRLELKGINVGDRWEQIALYLMARIHEHALPFQDLHYVYALARAGKVELVNEMLFSMQAYTMKASSHHRKTWIEVALPAAKGMKAHATGDWGKAITQLSPILSRLYEIGGSHAQRDLFEQVYLDAWLRNEQNHQALQILEKRVATHRYIASMQLNNNISLLQAS